MSSGAVRRFVQAVLSGLALQAAAMAWAQTPFGSPPHIVLQPAVNAFQLAAWLPDSRFLLTSFRFGHELILWDTKLGVVVDRIPLPRVGSGPGTQSLFPDKIVLAADGKSALVHAMMDMGEGGAFKELEIRADLQSRTAALARSWVVRPKPQPKPGLSSLLGDLIGSIAMAVAPMAELIPSTPEEEDSKFPLPSSPDGKTMLRHAATGLKAITGKKVVMLPANKLLGYSGGALDPRGRRLALVAGPVVEEEDEETRTLEIWDLQTSELVLSTQIPDNLQELAWVDADHLAGIPLTSADGRTSSQAGEEGTLDDIIIVEATTGKTRAVPARCYVKALPGGGLIGAGLANCTGTATPGSGLQMLDPAGARWQALPSPLPPGTLIDGLAVSPDGGTIAAAVNSPANLPAIVLIDRKTGRELNRLSGKRDETLTLAAFAADGTTLAIAREDKLQLWKTGGTELVPLDQTVSPFSMVAGNANTLVTSSLIDGNVSRFDLASGKRLPPLKFTSSVAGGFVPGKSLFWSASYLGEVRLWDTGDWTELLTTHHFAGQGFVTATPEGIYDTNLGPDAPAFRWIVPDAPFQSLAAQTFMRDYFEPNLTQRLFECREQGTCLAALPPRPPLTALNRVLPVVRIAAIKPGRPGWVTVEVEAQEGTDPRAANGKVSSGLYDVRLFRNNRLVGHQPGNAAEVLHQNLAEWRQSNRPPGSPDPTGTWHFSFEVPLPTAAGTELSEFSAYAFNEDRVKSETARTPYRRAPAAPRRPRAYILTIGLDSYSETRLTLHYAAADARLLADRLATIPGYEIRPAILTSEVLPDGRTRMVTKATIRTALKALVGTPAAPEDQAALAGFDITQLAQVTPDDLVIITYSGHGYADPRGDFFLVPADAVWSGNAVPAEHSLISTADLTTYLRDVRAGEIALIIDACHSAASVTAGAFKPGPMGDAGLGQLAYDQGILVLAASQADDVARESPLLGQGLLTYALAGEGLTRDGGKADRDAKGRITLDAWLRYAVRRTPGLSTQISLGQFARPTAANGASRDFTLLDAKPKPGNTPQVPALFHFNRGPSPVVLRGAHP